MLSIFIWIIIPAVASLLLIPGSLDCSGWQVMFFIIGLVSITFLICIIITIPINRLQIHSQIEGIEAIRKTIYNARQRNNTYEIAALTQKLTEYNKWIAVNKYWAKFKIFEVFIPREILSLEEIK